MNEIYFYRANEKPYGVFSNLYQREIKIAGQTFPTVEHAYQWLKPRDHRVRDWLMAAPAPSLVAMAAHTMQSDEADPTEIMGRTADILLSFHTRPGWSRLRYPWMFACLHPKFSQNADLRDHLLSTENAEIVEAGKIDDDAGRRWGRINGRGSNYLGRMLMLKRAELGGAPYEDADLEKRLAAGHEALQVALQSIAEEMSGIVIPKRRTTRELEKASTETLLHELERRQFLERGASKKVCHRWVCDKCGNEVVGGLAWEKSYVDAGRVWCSVCDPGRPDFYGTRGQQSVPMRHVIEQTS